MINQEVYQQTILKPVQKAEFLELIRYYDPNLERFALNLRRMLSEGKVFLLRLHPGSEYPMNKEIRAIKSREGHALILFGYDEEGFLLFDPWNKDHGQARNGIIKLKEEELLYTVCDGSTDMALGIQ